MSHLQNCLSQNIINTDPVVWRSKGFCALSASVLQSVVSYEIEWYIAFLTSIWSRIEVY
jgi:hypothetical protein